MARIVIVNQFFLPHIGGIEIVVEQEVRALTAQGHDVTLVVSDATGEGHAPEENSRLRIIRVPALHTLERLFSIPYPIFSPTILPLLWKEIAAADVVHVHASLCAASLPALAIARALGRPSILTEHVVFGEPKWAQPSWYLERIGMNTVGRACARLATRIVTFNDRVLELMEKLARTKEKTAFVPYLIDEARFHRPTARERRLARQSLGWTDDRPKVIFAGRLIADKGIFLLAKAQDPAFDLAYCGPGADPIKKALVEAGATCLGPFKQADMARVYHAADLLVLPSCREGFPVVAKEALACGLPVILADDKGFRRYKNQEGLSFCARDPESVRDAILSALRTTRRGTKARWAANPFDHAEWIGRIYGPLPGPDAAPRYA